MRFQKFALLGIAALIGAALNAQEIQPNTEAAAAAIPPAFTDAQAIEAFGWFLAHQSGLVALGFTKEEVELMSRGMAVAVSGQPSPHDFEKIGPTIQALIAKRKDEAFTRLRNQGLEETAQFMTEVRAKEGVVTMDNGMAYEVISAGTGPKPRADQWVKVSYVGKLVSGAVFDRSEEGNTVEFALDGVIDGWREGMQNVNEGSKVILYIPPHLAYGDNGTPEIPPGSTLIFEVELLEVKDAPPADAAAPATGG
jgi:FKBP-type peptidyl-prolyl cis-trans isomerase